MHFVVLMPKKVMEPRLEVTKIAFFVLSSGPKYNKMQHKHPP